MRIVLDTNVLVSGLLSPWGAPAVVVRLAVAGELQLAVDPRIVDEYREVLSRPRFGFDPEDVRTILEHLTRESRWVSCRPLPTTLPDPDDEVFLEVALAAGADALVTGNSRHFPAASACGVCVLSPAELVARLRCEG